jgi:nucleoid DNA-binding protein
MSKLPSLGWKVEYVQSALDDNDYKNDWSGFYFRWRKEGFDGELWILASYNQFDEETEVIFDKTPIYKSTYWIEELQNNICIYENLNAEKCFEIADKSKVEKIKALINKAIDLDKEELPNREKISVIDFGKMEVKVYYGNDKEIYFQSEKGIKIMKPEPEFFELTNLSQ